jgi:large subunit ribosomal protein L30
LRTIQSLGLGRVNNSVEVEYTPQIQGMVKKVNHLVSVTEL